MTRAKTIYLIKEVPVRDPIVSYSTYQPFTVKGEVTSIEYTRDGRVEVVFDHGEHSVTYPLCAVAVFEETEKEAKP